MWIWMDMVVVHMEEKIDMQCYGGGYSYGGEVGYGGYGYGGGDGYKGCYAGGYGMVAAIEVIFMDMRWRLLLRLWMRLWWRLWMCFFVYVLECSCVGMFMS